MNSRFSISVKNVRAIEEAGIDLNGITVLTGENGCGKTTISKLLYSFIKTSVNFDSIVSGLYSKDFSWAASFLDDFIPRKARYTFDSDEEIDFPDSNDNILNIAPIYSSKTYSREAILSRIQLIRKKYKEKEYSISATDFKRLLQLYKRRVRETIAKNVIELLDDYEAYIKELIQQISDLKMTHSLKVYNHEFSKHFNEITEKWDYSLKEYDSSLINRQNDFVTLQKTFSDAFYIDVPTVFDYDFGRSSVREPISSDLKEALLAGNASSEEKEISHIINEALNGRISKRDDLFSQIFVYTAKDGKSIPLSQAASGVKCFAVLERLYANGCLRADTLLVVDEPEVHLHPKWIVEYARVLVFIQKYLHTTLLIASHNPDMISAIKYIAEKEKCSDSLTFYIAEEVDTNGFGKYKFKNLGTDIESIFKSFNIALDRISQYGAFEDE